MGKVYFPETPWADRVINQCVGFPAGKHDDAVDVCALIGMALDSTHAAPVPVNRKPRIRDRWQRLFDKFDDEDHINWKVA